jgi:hypothetical protein
MTSERGSQDDVFVNRTNCTTVGPPVGSYSLAESGALGSRPWPRRAPSSYRSTQSSEFFITSMSFQSPLAGPAVISPSSGGVVSSPIATGNHGFLRTFPGLSDLVAPATA